jgi:plastocyanin
VTVDNTLPPPGSDRANHNLTIYTDASASETVFRGDAVALGDAHTFHVPALAKGLYFFRCDIHPLPMTGVVVVG